MNISHDMYKIAAKHIDSAFLRGNLRSREGDKPLEVNAEDLQAALGEAYLKGVRDGKPGSSYDELLLAEECGALEVKVKEEGKKTAYSAYSTDDERAKIYYHYGMFVESPDEIVEPDEFNRRFSIDRIII